MSGFLWTYLIHSTVLLSAALVLDRRVLRTAAVRETMWKVAVLGAIGSAALPLLFRAAQDGGGERYVIMQAHQSLEGPGVLRGFERDGDVLRERMDARVDEACFNQRLGRGLAQPLGPPRPERPGGTLRAMADCRLGAAGGGAGTVLLLVGVGLGALVLVVRHLLASAALFRIVASGTVVKGLSRGRVRVLRAEGIGGPVAVGWRTVLLPGRVLDTMPLSRIRTIVAHEVAHLRRGDPGWLWLLGLIEGVFFFQPLNRIARRRIDEVSELLSDDAARRDGGSGLELARSIAQVSEWRVGAERLAPALSRGTGRLSERVERLLRPASSAGLPDFHVRLAIAVVLLATASLLPRPEVPNRGLHAVDVSVEVIYGDVTAPTVRGGRF